MTVYTLWNQAVTPGSQVPFTGTLGTEFNLSESTPLTGIWIYSPEGAAGLPSACAIYDIDTSTQVAGTLNNSPSWSGAEGSGWVKVTYDGSVTLNSGVNYATACYFPDIAAAYDGSFSWPVNPDIIDGTAALYSVVVGLSIPDTNAGAFSYYIDPEVTTAPPPATGPPLFAYVQRRV